MILASGQELIDIGYCCTLYSPLKIGVTDFQLKNWSLKNEVCFGYSATHRQRLLNKLC
jgi:hypothetical protein